MKWGRLLLIFVVLGVASCAKKNKLSNIPNITFESLNQDSVRSGNNEDSISIYFKFQDGDADIGNDPKTGKFDVFLTDSRDTSMHLNFFLPSIPSDFKDPSTGIVGYAKISINAALLIYDTTNVNNNTLHYDVYMKDIAGHESNHFLTPDIHILP